LAFVFLLAADQTRGKHLRVVEDQGVALLEILVYVREEPVLDVAGSCDGSP
jgi:hypothetical protein